MDLEVASAPRVALRESAWGAIAVLTLINVFNYIDRFVITALLPHVQSEFSLNDTQGGMLGSAFMVVYFLTSPVFGRLGDRGQRKIWIALGVGLWSLATGAAGLATGFATLLLARALVGVGEGAYGTISPSLLADYVPKERRARVMSVFFLAIPVGSALGYVLGGVLGEAFGWRNAFYAVGFPGLVLAGLAYFMHEPERGRFDPPETRGTVPLGEALRELAASRTYVWTVVGYVAYTFAIGGLAFWMPSYLIRERGFAAGEGTLIFGGITVVAGAVGTLVGGFIGDKLQARSKNGYVYLSIVAMLVGAALALAALRSSDRAVFLVCLALSELFLFLNTGPVNALLVSTVRPGTRATANAIAIFCIHLFGDLGSPTLIGMVADHSGLGAGMMIIPGVFFLAGVLWLGSYERAARAT